METAVNQLNMRFITIGVFCVIMFIVSATASYLNIRTAETKRERLFAIQGCSVVWLLLISIILIGIFLEAPYKYISIGILIILFPLVVYRFALRRQLLKVLDERDKKLSSESEDE